MNLSFHAPQPSTRCTIFHARLILFQKYNITSPRTPDEAPLQYELPKQYVLYEVGRRHEPGQKYPGVETESLWRGVEAGGAQMKGVDPTEADESWQTRAVVRLPDHTMIRPTTPPG